MLRTTLRQVEVFVAIAREGNVTQAAKGVGLTQSAASMALADLEDTLGTKLFDRAGRRLSLNEDGRALYGKAVEMLARAQEIEGYFRREGRGADLRLGASSTVGNYVLPQIIGELAARHPDSRVRLEVGNTQRVIDAVARFEVDVGFVEGPCAHPDIDAVCWREDELAVCAAPSHPLADGKGNLADRLAGTAWILRERGSGTREVVEQMLTDRLGAIRPGLELGDTEAIKRAVEAGLGVSCLPKIVLEDAVARGRIVCLPTPFLRLKRSFFVLVHRQKYRTEGLRRLLALCGLPDAG